MGLELSGVDRCKLDTNGRCSPCLKRAHSSENDAAATAVKLWEKDGRALRPYFSRKCGWWHLTTDTDEPPWLVSMGYGEVRITLQHEAHMATGTQVTKYDEMFAKIAQDYAGGERASGTFFSVKGGVLTLGDDTMPGNQLCAVVLDYVQERTYYADKYQQDREVNNPPVCYAFKRPEDEEEMAPHPSMQVDLSYFKPQNDICKTCPMNGWGTADTGRGKACAERRRLALLPAGYYTPRRGSRDFDLHFITDVDHYVHADIAYLKLPVTSVAGWARYVTSLAAQHRRPPLAVATRIYIEPDPKHQFKVKFEMIEQLPDELFEIIMKRHEEAKASIIFGYPPPSGDQTQPAQSIRR